MDKKKLQSISGSFKQRAIWGIAFTAFSIAISITFFRYVNYTNQITELEKDYLSNQKKRVKQVVLNTTSYINFIRSSAEQRLKDRVKDRVYEAHAVATNIYNEFNGKRPDTEIKKLIKTALRAPRFFAGTGHYYIHSSDGILQLHPKKPELEGSNRLNHKDSTGRFIAQELWEIINKSGEGFLSYGYTSKDNKNREQTKTSFVKHFEPFDWLIGTGDYLTNIDNELQKIALDYIKQVTFGENSYIFVVNYKGTVVMNVSQPHLIGKDIWNLKDPNGVMVIHEERKAVENPEGGFINYVWNKPSTSTPSPKISFMKGIKDWQWMVGAGVYVDDINTKIALVRTELKNELILQSILIILMTAIITFFILIMLNKLALKLGSEINQFINFFTTNKLKLHKIDIEQLKYSELRELAISANQMVDAQTEADVKRIAAENSLRSSEHNLKEAQKITHLGNWEYDFSTGNVAGSDEFYNIFGLNKDLDETTFDFITNIIHPSDREKAIKDFDESVNNRKPFVTEYRIILKEGNERVVKVYGVASYDEAGNPIKSSGTAQDITQLSEKEAQLRRIQKMDAVGQLTGGIAHDFNNILGIILGNLSFLNQEVSGKETALKRVKTITKAAQRAADLTKQLLGFSRKQEMLVQSTNINQLIQGMENLLSRSITPEVEVEHHFSDSLWLTKVDQGELEDAILNLTLNARDAMQGNGRLTIETCNCTLDEAYCAQNAGVSPGQYVQLTVSDTGTGISLELQERIYEPFFTTKTEGKGTGLGLAMVFGFTKRTGGHIKVYSELGVGTTFRLYLPRTEDQQTPDDVIDQTAVTLPAGNETILAVDDEEDLLELAKESLQSLGYHVFTASNGNQALEQLNSEPSISLLFSDVVMPGNMNGYELAEQATANNENLKVLLTSGYTKKSLAHNGQARFNANLLTKPYTQFDLAHRVRALLGESNVSHSNKADTEQKEVKSNLIIEWNDTLATGIKEVDDDHRILIGLLNQCQQLEEDSTGDKLNQIMFDLKQYAQHHFKREEAIMKACEYPGIDNHCQVHNLLIRQVEEQLRQHKQGKTSIDHLREFLQSWVVDHIKGMDKSFAPYCEGKEELIMKTVEQFNADFIKGASS